MTEYSNYRNKIILGEEVGTYIHVPTSVINDLNSIELKIWLLMWIPDNTPVTTYFLIKALALSKKTIYKNLNALSHKGFITKIVVREKDGRHSLTHYKAVLPDG